MRDVLYRHGFTSSDQQCIIKATYLSYSSFVPAPNPSFATSCTGVDIVLTCAFAITLKDSDICRDAELALRISLVGEESRKERTMSAFLAPLSESVMV